MADTMKLYAATKHLDEQLCRRMFDQKDESAVRSVLEAQADAKSALDSIYAIRDEYRAKRAAALDQMEFNAQQGNTAGVSLYSTEAERHGAALIACNRILKALSADTTVRLTPSAAPFALTENASVWPDGRAKRSSCTRHRACMYGCAAHRDKDITADVDRAAATAQPAVSPVAEKATEGAEGGR